MSLQFVFQTPDPDPVTALVARGKLPAECAALIEEIREKLAPPDLRPFSPSAHCLGTFLDGCRPNCLVLLSGTVAKIDTGERSFYLRNAFMANHASYPYATNLEIFHKARRCSL